MAKRRGILPSTRPPFIVEGRPTYPRIIVEPPEKRQWSTVDNWKFRPDPGPSELPERDLRTIRIRDVFDLLRLAQEAQE